MEASYTLHTVRMLPRQEGENTRTLPRLEHRPLPRTSPPTPLEVCKGTSRLKCSRGLSQFWRLPKGRHRSRDTPLRTSTQPAPDIAAHFSYTFEPRFKYGGSSALIIKAVRRARLASSTPNIQHPPPDPPRFSRPPPVLATTLETQPSPPRTPKHPPRRPLEGPREKTRRRSSAPSIEGPGPTMATSYVKRRRGLTPPRTLIHPTRARPASGPETGPSGRQIRACVEA